MCGINGFNFKNIDLIHKMLAASFSRSSDLDYCQELFKEYRGNYCDLYLIWNVISFQMFLRKHNF